MIERKKKSWQLFAVIMTVILFVILLYLDSLSSQASYVRQLDQASVDIQKKFDEKIQTLLAPLPKLTQLITPLEQCTETIRQHLGEFAFVQPKLSTVAVHSNKLPRWCISPEFDSIIKPRAFQHQPRLIGPVRNMANEESYFILQYPGNQHIVYYLFLLKSVLESAIHSSSPLVNKVTLVNLKNEMLLSKSFHDHGVSDKRLSIESRQKSEVINNIVFRVEANEAFMQSGNRKRAWALRLLSFTLAVLFLVFLMQRINRSFSMDYILQKAIQYNEFYPIFQPIVEAGQHKIVGAEILIRWRDSYGNHIPPNHFIEEAELTMNIIPMTKMLIEQAFQQFSAYMQANRHFHLGINLCRAHFIDDNWLPTLLKLCQKYDILPKQLLLEVTERTMIDTTNLDLAAKMHALHDAGFELAIDDFGTSHASISYLRHFPLDYLKIDMMYVQAIGTGAITEALLPPIILIANQLNLKIIAEGIENEQQLQYLKQQNTDYYQGWFFSKAIEAKELLKQLH